jgi:hypothetical protein
MIIYLLSAVIGGQWDVPLLRLWGNDSTQYNLPMRFCIARGQAYASHSASFVLSFKANIRPKSVYFPKIKDQYFAGKQSPPWLRKSWPPSEN